MYLPVLLKQIYRRGRLAIPRRTRTFAAALLFLIAPAQSLPAVAQERLTFVGVALDVETRQADRVLQDYLYRRAEVEFAPEELDYASVIDRLANWKPGEGHYLARTTPYVYVAAEMLGADFEILATYRSATTNRTTYNAFLVVNRESFPSRPDLQEVIRFLRESDRPAEHVYHSKFSTSSFFLPALYFREHNIFNMAASTESLTAIHTRQIEENSSTKLVQLVARGEADLAAVWDGTKAKFEPGHPRNLHAEFGERVHFIKLPTPLPNDLLVCSASLDPEVKDRIRDAVRSMGPDEIGQGDFKTWEDIREATEARLALAGLRWLARERTAPVTVEVRLHEDAEPDTRSTALLEATRQAVRLSGSEFILFDEDFHEHIDVQWTLEPIHDDAIVLRSAIPGSGLLEQEFQLSFRDTEGLTKRISALIHSRMHRIRYLWPYSEGPPIVIRDTASSIPVGSTVKVQRISWLDPQKNSFRAGPLFDARIREAGFYKYRLDASDFPDVNSRGFGLDAMSNDAYRVILVRPEQERPIFRALTVAFVALLVLAAGGAAFDMRRERVHEVSVERRAVAPSATPSPGEPREAGVAVARGGPDLPARPKSGPDPWH
jgi:ABC-type phosphate/phosphonate transport system substrate-binding protein